MGFLLLGLIGFGLAAFAVTGLSSSDDDDDDDGPVDPVDPGDVIDGTPADDILAGGGNDVVSGAAGDDEVTVTDTATGRGNAGDDRLIGGDGSTIYGNLGGDVLQATGNATAYGGPGFDFLRGDGTSTLYGGAGNDQMSRDTGDDATDGEVVFYGDGGNDLIRAHEGSTAHGGEGADRISALRGSVGYGETGDDRLGAGPGGSIFGGAGDDRLSAGSYGDNPELARADGGRGSDFILAGGLTEANGGLGADTLVGSVNVIDGSADGPALSGGAGGDLFIASITQDSDAVITITDFTPGRDSLALSISGVSGNESATDFTYQGFDVVPGEGFVDLVVRFQQPDDTGALTGASQTVRLEGLSTFDPAMVQFAVPDGDDSYTLMDLVQGSPGRDVLEIDGPVLVDLGGGADVFTGGGATQYIFGGTGADSVTLPEVPTTATEDSFISLGNGNDSLDGGFSGQIIDGGNGNDSLILHSGDTSTALLNAVDGGNGNDAVTITGDFAANGRIEGGGGLDTLSASVGQGTFLLDDTEADTLTLLFNPDLSGEQVPQTLITGDDADQVIIDSAGFDGTLHQVNRITENDGEGATFYSVQVQYFFVAPGVDSAAVIAAWESGGSTEGVEGLVTLSDRVINYFDEPPFGGGEPGVDDFALPAAVLDRALASVSTIYTVL